MDLIRDFPRRPRAGRRSLASELRKAAIALDEQAVAAVSQRRFEPQQLAGTPVEVLATVMLDRQCTAVRQSTLLGAIARKSGSSRAHHCERQWRLPASRLREI